MDHKNLSPLKWAIYGPKFSMRCSKHTKSHKLVSIQKSTRATEAQQKMQELEFQRLNSLGTEAQLERGKKI